MVESTTPESTAAATPRPRTLFSFSVRKGEREVVALYAFASDGVDDVTVVAEIWSTHARGDGEPQRQFHVFPSRDRADHFVNETLAALEYIGCTVSHA